MNNLYIIFNQLTNGYNEAWFLIFPVLAIFSGIFIIISKNPIISVLFLIGLFLNIACLLVLLGLNFLGLSYLLVYVGAVSILFLFILMLISIRSSDLTSNTQNSIPLAIIVSILFIIISQKVSINNYYQHLKTVSTNNLDTEYIINSIDNLSIHNNIYNIESDIFNYLSLENSYFDSIFSVSAVSWDKYIIELSHISSIGNIIYTNYSIWLVLTSLILLLAMIGAIVITIKPITEKET